MPVARQCTHKHPGLLSAYDTAAKAAAAHLDRQQQQQQQQKPPAHPPQPPGPTSDGVSDVPQHVFATAWVTMINTWDVLSTLMPFLQLTLPHSVFRPTVVSM